MYKLNVNGREVEAKSDKKLMAFLRDDLRLTSVKDGCSEGACGACTIIIDGKAMRACISRVSKIEGKKIVTIEGLSQREKDVYSHCFAKAGAVQCGFCIPGMVLSAKALLDVNQNPSEEDIRKAIRSNICRCTGYARIFDAISMAAAMFREDTPIPVVEYTARLGEDFPRIDAVDKTLGTGIYVDDIEIEGMLYAKALRSKYPRAKVLKIDTNAASNHGDCVRILTAQDVPGSKKIGHLVKDWDVFIAQGDTTRYVGDAIALVVSKSKDTLDEITSLINIDYEVLTPMTSPLESLAENAPLLHEKGNLLRHERLNRGDVETALANAAHIVKKHYSVPFTEHAFMEPECAIALPEGEGVLVYTGGQSVYDEQHEIAEMLALPYEKVHVHSMYVGGGFGGKEDMSVQHHAALAAYIVGQPVKVKLSRQESINIHPKRHAMEMEFTTGCDAQGNLVGLKADIIADTGAYASLGGPVLQRACTHAAGPYHFENVVIDGKAVYTNNPPGGAFRGFGVTQSSFAMECNLNILAEMVGISPWEIRYKNAVRPGDVLPNGQIVDDSTAMEECLKAVKDIFEAHPYAGIASSFKNSGIGVGIPDISRVLLSIEEGKVHIRTSAACIGQGMGTVTTQILCHATGISPKRVIVEAPDTIRTPNAGTTTASRQTVFTGEATKRAALLLKAELDKGESLKSLEGQEFYGEYGSETDPIGSEKKNPISHIAYGYAAQVVILDETGKVQKVVAAYDLGRVVNPRSSISQIEGGIAMGLGYALTEDYPIEGGYPKAKYGTLGLWRSTEMPEMQVIFAERDFEEELAFGAKGVGELATIPTAPAVQLAYYRLDGKFRTKLPLENTFYSKK